MSAALERQASEEDRKAAESIAAIRAGGWKPKRDNVFVRPIGARATQSGLVLVEHKKNLYGKGEIVGVGTDVAAGKFGDLKPGDEVIFAEEASLPSAWPGVVITHASAVVGVLVPGTAFESYRGAGR